MNRRLHLVLLLAAMVPLVRAGETIDRIVAVVNGSPVMESEMVESLRLEQVFANQPPQAVPSAELRAVLGRLVDQILLTKQMDVSHFQQTTPEEVHARINDLRTAVAPSDEEWRILLARYDLSEEDVAGRIAQQLRTERYIDAHFRPSVRLDPGAVENYYKDQLVPKLKQAGAQPVPMKEVEPKIREILVQQRIDDLLESWLKTLRTQAEIRMPAPSSALVEAQAVADGHPAEVR
ncbi:MAG: hypothetical protein ACJ71N_12640 [Terriglobales bacterium]|jgi:peptidyl-prolyl cis-trans isomerase SurA